MKMADEVRQRMLELARARESKFDTEQVKTKIGEHDLDLAGEICTKWNLR